MKKLNTASINNCNSTSSLWTNPQGKCFFFFGLKWKKKTDLTQTLLNMVKPCCSMYNFFGICLVLTLLGNRHTRVILIISYNLIIKMQTGWFVWTPILKDIWKHSTQPHITWKHFFQPHTWFPRCQISCVSCLLSLVTSQNPKIPTIILSLSLCKIFRHKV